MDQLKGDYLKIANVQAEEESALMHKSNVVGVGVGHKIKNSVDTGDPALTVFVNQKVPKSLLSDDDLVPSKVSSFQTDVVPVGEIFAGGASPQYATQPANIDIQTLSHRVRPVEGGFSVGHPRVTAGTMATAVIDSQPFPGVPDHYYMLSNNHVLANSNDAYIGDPILQPGAIDGGTLPADAVARLARYIPIHFDGRCNYVDAAIAEGPFHLLDREIYWIGYISGLQVPEVGMLVQKTGRTTNYTTGTVISINATFDVNYGGGRVARMCRQIATTNMSAGGDSGSLLCDMDENAVGLLFAGSPVITLHNYIGMVLSLLNIRIP